MSILVTIRNNKVEINGVVVDNKIFEDEKSDYKLIEKSEQVDNLILWISECGYRRESDKTLMKADLEYLMTLDDEYIFSSINTNEYIAYSDEPTVFYDICSDLLEQSGLSQDKIEELLLDDKKDETQITLLGHEIKIVPSIDNLTSRYYDDAIDSINQDILDGNDGGTFKLSNVEHEWNFVTEKATNQVFLIFSTDAWQSRESYELEGVSSSLEIAQDVVKKIFDKYGCGVKAVIQKTEVDSNDFKYIEVYEFKSGLEWKNDTNTELGYLAQETEEED